MFVEADIITENEKYFWPCQRGRSGLETSKVLILARRKKVSYETRAVKTGILLMGYIAKQIWVN